MPARSRASSRALALLAVAVAPLLLGARGCATGGLSCEERVEAAVSYVDSAIGAHPSCTQDSDCTTVDPSTGCQGRCPAVVAVAGVDAARDAVAYADRTWCQGFAEGGCGYATPSCMYLVPGCDQGRCVLLEPVGRPSSGP